MKPSSLRVARGAAAASLLVVALMTLNERAAAAAETPALAAAAASKEAAPAGDKLALASNRQSQRVAVLPVARRETLVTQHAVSSEHRMSAAAGGPADLSAGQSIANAKVQTGALDLQPAAAGHYGGGKHHGKYYMYAESPKKGAYKAGFKRGNHKHMIERKEAQHKSHAHGYMKWHDKKGKGSHKWEYKHSKGKHHHY